MKVLLINGSPHQHGCIDAAMQEVIGELHKEGIETELLWLGTQPMQDCIACNRCQETGRCVFEDQVNQVAAKLDAIDAILIGSPVYYGGPNGRLQSFLDRLFYSVGNETFNGKFGASIVSCRRGGATATFERLNQYFTIANMHVVSSQYWNMVHGFTAEDVKKDQEGLQTMRTLARNLAWLLKATQGKEKPVHEEQIFTSFPDHL
ncbi:MAG: flavodoxin family protein [Erysipelotrichaceae bacterium]|nr:flavodoxin family protein [Erysipelotrichaceae bacterium]